MGFGNVSSSVIYNCCRAWKNFHFTSCKKDFDDPTINVVPTGNVLTIAEVRALYQPGKTIKIAEDISVYGVVTMDESTGNLYKESFITDGTGNLYKANNIIKFSRNIFMY